MVETSAVIEPKRVASPVKTVFPSLKAKKRTICVLGVPQGGTSMVAGLLRQMGVNMGDNIDPDNNEDLDFLFHDGDRSIFTERSKNNVRMAYIADIQALIASRNHSLSVWGWKDPLAIYYINDVMNDLRNVHFIFVTRDIGAVAEREFLLDRPGSDGKLLNYLARSVHEYGLAVDFLAAAARPTLLVSYERGLRHPIQMIRSIADFIGADAIEPADLERMVRYVTPDRLTGRLDAEVSSEAPMAGLEARIRSSMAATKLRLATQEMEGEGDSAADLGRGYAEAAQALNGSDLTRAENAALGLLARLARTHEAVALGPEAVLLSTHGHDDTAEALPDILVGIYYILGTVKLRQGQPMEAKLYYAAGYRVAEQRLLQRAPNSVQSAHLLWPLKFHEGLAFRTMHNIRMAGICRDVIIDAGNGLCPAALTEQAGRPAETLLQRARSELAPPSRR